MNEEYIINSADEDLSYIDFKNPGGIESSFVPDAETAYKVAKVYLDKQFSKSLVDSQMPYHISLDSKLGLWLIRGTVCTTGTGGGAINIIIRKSDGKVMAIALEA